MIVRLMAEEEKRCDGEGRGWRIRFQRQGTQGEGEAREQSLSLRAEESTGSEELDSVDLSW